jgi:hypothetical protein
MHVATPPFLSQSPPTAAPFLLARILAFCSGPHIRGRAGLSARAETAAPHHELRNRCGPSNKPTFTRHNAGRGAAALRRLGSGYLAALRAAARRGCSCSPAHHPRRRRRRRSRPLPRPPAPRAPPRRERAGAPPAGRHAAGRPCAVAARRWPCR